MNFCRRCGSKLQNLKNHIFRCENDHILFANNSPTAGIFLIDMEGNILLSVRGIEPYKGMLDVFGGFLESNESTEAAITRELQEELSLEPSEYTTPTFLCSAVGNYPFKAETLPLIGSFFYAKLLTDRELIPADDVAAIYKAKTIDAIDFTRMGEDIKKGLHLLQSVLDKEL